jgi:hypothetical protein
VRGAALSADGVHAIYFDANNRWVASNAITGRECELPFALDMVYGIGFSHNGRLAAVTLAKSPRSAMDRVRLKFQSHRWLHVYDTATGEEVCDPIYRGSQCWFSPDGKLLAVEYNHNQIAVWNWPMAPPRWPLACTLGTASAFGSLAIAALWSRRRKKVNPASAGLTATPSST